MSASRTWNQCSFARPAGARCRRPGGLRTCQNGHGLMKYAANRPYFDPEKAARKLLEIANAVEVVHDGRIYIELINGPFLFDLKETPDEFLAGLDLAIERGWL